MTTKQTFWRTFAIMVAIFLTMPATVWADSTFGGGNGTMAAPYIISTPQHLRQLAADVNEGNDYEGKYFKMTQSFSCWIEPFTPIGGKYYTVGSGNNSSTGTRKFRGNFDGNGYTINDLDIRPTEDFYGIGLFGELGDGAHVSNLTIASSQITTTIKGWGNCGAIAGSVNSDAFIYDCHVKEGVVVSVDPNHLAQNIQSSCDFGGIAGENGGIINQCTSKATVTNAGINGVNTLGGIVGRNSGRVWSCFSLAIVNGTSKVGGIAGDNAGAYEYSDNYYHSAPAIGAVNGTDVDGASWMGTISFDGGLSTSIITPPTFSYKGVNYYAQGRTCSIGLNLKVNDGYIPVDPQLTSEQVEFYDDAVYGTQVKSFTFPAGQDVVIGCSYSELKRDIGYAPWVGIDIPWQKYTGAPLTPVVTVTDNMTGEAVTLTEGVDYSITLPAEDMIEAGDYAIIIAGMGRFAGSATARFVIAPFRWKGDGTESNPYQICTVGDMLLLADETQKENFAGTHFVLMDDLDFSGVEYKTVGGMDNMFCGVFDGNGKTIDNATLNSTNKCSGLFGYVCQGGEIKNLISGSGNTFHDQMNVGGIVGYLVSSKVTNCTSYATIVADKQSTYTGRYAGGVVGTSTEGYITNCRNYGSVAASSYAGGIIGIAQFGSLTGCVNFAAVTADNYCGGIIGKHDYLSINNNYYAGECNIGGINGSDTNGQAMRGYTITGDKKVVVELVDDAAIGLTCNGVTYAGAEQQVTIHLSKKRGAAASQAPSTITFMASSGELVDNGDGTWKRLPTRQATSTATATWMWKI